MSRGDINDTNMNSIKWGTTKMCKHLCETHRVTHKNRRMVDIKSGWCDPNYWARAAGQRTLCSSCCHWWIIENETDADREDECVKVRESIWTGGQLQPRVNLREWMNTCHAPRRVTEYGQAADCFSKSGFASFPLVQLSNKEHSSPRGCAGGKWKRDKCICFYSDALKWKK